MARVLTRFVRGAALLAAGLLCAVPSASAQVTAAPAHDSGLPTAHSAPSPLQVTPPAHRQTAADSGELTVSITQLDPGVLETRGRLTVSGTVRNGADHTWFDAQVYLAISGQPATTKAGLDQFALSTDDSPDTRIVAYGLFDQLGALSAGEHSRYRLRIPFSQLPISGEPGVYHVDVIVLSSLDAKGATRDAQADARADTLLALLPPDVTDVAPTEVVTLLPVAAPVARRLDGTFLEDSLAAAVAPGGRLRNLLDFADRLPQNSVQLIADPAVLQALEDMTQGYRVQTLQELADGQPAARGSGQRDATGWLDDFHSLQSRQQVLLMPWGDPDTAALAQANLRGVVDAAVAASQRYAFDHQISGTVVDWQSYGDTTRLALSVARSAGASVHVVSQRTLVHLVPDEQGYAPSAVTVPTQHGPLTTTVSRADVAGVELTATLTSLDFRQALMAETCVRALRSTDQGRTTLLVTTASHWDPGPVTPETAPTLAYQQPDVASGSLVSVAGRAAATYRGSVEVPTHLPGLETGLLDGVKALREAGRVYTDLLTDGRQASVDFDQQLATAGSSVWRWQPKRGEALTRQAARSLNQQVGLVTVTGPEFVAMSSDSGKFPLTVTNGLAVPVTVRLDVRPVNPALHIVAPDELQLQPSQQLDVDIESRADGSGVTAVRARLQTTTQRSFGRPWGFDVRATQIGLAVWILMAVLGTLLFTQSAVRIVRRIRTGNFRPRGESGL
ncbi:MAG: DUF6049 family protein [Nocardioidaceae bacterium]